MKYFKIEELTHSLFYIHVAYDPSNVKPQPFIEV